MNAIIPINEMNDLEHKTKTIYALQKKSILPD